MRAAGEIHPYVEEVTDEVGIDSTVGFNYSVVVCALAEKYCPEETSPGWVRGSYGPPKTLGAERFPRSGLRSFVKSGTR